jgi:hypothetical protein
LEIGWNRAGIADVSINRDDELNIDVGVIGAFIFPFYGFLAEVFPRIP